ncbi:MAG: homocysteine S-methyltransferase family protein [Clostridia bacterium]|nr:homocysteine S-methyltransferase family protein [Clostridia bacterium]
MIKSILGKKPLVFDGAMGTMLQNANLKAGALTETLNTLNPDEVMKVHLAYIDAGADVITSNSFSANKAKMSPFSMNEGEEMIKAVTLAKKAVEQSGKEVFVAADIGPTGKLMSPLGDMSFEEAVSSFASSCAAAEKAAADMIFFETMSDLYECKAAITAARENSNLPVAVSLTFDESGHTLTGADAKTVACYLSSLDVDAIGINCGLGPDVMENIAIELAKCSKKPIIVNANAGLPKIDENGKTYFDVPPERFYSFAKNLVKNGISAVGGCCGTNPDYIKNVKNALMGEEIIKPEQENFMSVCSGTRVYTFSGKTAVVGERLNPTGKPKLKEALKNNNLDYLCAEAVAQEAAGADILDVNVGIPDIDEVEMLPKVVLALQKVTDLPLQLDSANPKALSAAARVYNGIPIINSVNGKEENLESVLPIVKKYGALCVALLLDESGIPDSPPKRLAIADKIIKYAENQGVLRNRLLFDALTMTVATDENSGNKTLECVKNLSDNGYLTALGVSNISYGMPNRESINASFLGAAVARGLTAAIINPSSESMKLVLADENPNYDFVFDKEEQTINTQNMSKKEMTLFDAVYTGLSAKAYELAETMLAEKQPLEIIETELIPALNALGEGYELKKIFLPRLLGGAEAAKSAFKAVNSAFSGEKRENGMKIVIATVQGDIHDIGKNIVSTLLSNYGFEVIDLGKDVPPEKVVESVIENDVKLVGLSALMTTTVPAMAKTINLLQEKAPDTKIMVGGAVLTEDYAKTMGANFYGADAMASVKYAQSLSNLSK